MRITHVGDVFLAVVTWNGFFSQLSACNGDSMEVWCMPLPCAEIGFPVNSICRANFLGTARAKAIPGVEQKRPMVTLIRERESESDLNYKKHLKQISELMHYLIGIECHYLIWMGQNNRLASCRLLRNFPINWWCFIFTIMPRQSCVGALKNVDYNLYHMEMINDLMRG